MSDGARIRRTAKFGQPPPAAGTVPTKTGWAWWRWRLLPKEAIAAFFAAPNMAPPMGACGVDDLIGRRGAITTFTELTDEGYVAAYNACCPGCGKRVVELPQDRYPILGEPGQGFVNDLTCTVPLWFTGCCGWYGLLRGGMWIGRR